MPIPALQTLKNKTDDTQVVDQSKQQSSHLDMVEDFYLFLKTNNYSPATTYHYKMDLAIFDNFLISRNLGIKDLDKRAIFEFKAYLSSDERQTATTHMESAQRL